MVTEVTIRSGDDWKKLKSRAKNERAIGTIVARVLESQSQRTFIEQKIGDIEWPERYPTMDDPFVNLAALVNWTNYGGEIQPRFFDRRPALIGSGQLSKSISGEVNDDLVRVGSTLEYASIHQWGGTSSLPVTETAKQTIARFLGEEKVDGKWRKKKRIGSRQKENREKFWFKLMPLLGRDAIETQVNARPFLGITDENEREMAEGIEAFVAEGDD